MPGEQRNPQDVHDEVCRAAREYLATLDEAAFGAASSAMRQPEATLQFLPFTRNRGSGRFSNSSRRRHIGSIMLLRPAHTEVYAEIQDGRDAHSEQPKCNSGAARAKWTSLPGGIVGLLLGAFLVAVRSAS